MTEKTKSKKVIKKMVTIDGEKVPYYICPPGMSGLGLDLEKHFNQQDKEELVFEVPDSTQELELALKEDCGFVRSYQRYCDEGVVDDPIIEDFVAYKQINKYYDPEADRNKDLVSIFNS